MTEKRKSKGGRKPINRESIYFQAERFARELADLDAKREALMASIPAGVKKLMQVAGQLQKEMPVPPAPEPEAAAAPATPEQPKASKSNGKPNGHSAHAQA